MTGRLNYGFGSGAKELSTDIENFKRTQFFGQDSAVLSAYESGNPYDEAVFMDVFTRIDRYVEFVPTVKEWQESTYSQIHVQVWIDSLANPYHGTSEEEISVLPPSEDDIGGVPKLWQQIVNIGDSSHTVYIKYYVVTTATGGNVNVTT